MKSGIYVVATPIGNLNDISSRALEVLQNADVIACEDTRVTKSFFVAGARFEKTFVTLHDHNEEEQAQKLIDMVNRGQSIAQVSDAGCPLISDPGYKLIKRCREQGVAVTTIPGPCALICALQLSGLPTNSFMFAGFIPNKDKARKDLFNKLKDIDATLVFMKRLIGLSKLWKRPERSSLCAKWRLLGKLPKFMKSVSMAVRRN